MPSHRWASGNNNNNIKNKNKKNKNNNSRKIITLAIIVLQAPCFITGDSISIKTLNKITGGPPVIKLLIPGGPPVN